MVTKNSFQNLLNDGSTAWQAGREGAHLLDHAGDDKRILEDVLTEILVEPDALLLNASRSDFVAFGFSLFSRAFDFGHLEGTCGYLDYLQITLEHEKSGHFDKWPVYLKKMRTIESK